MPGESLVPAAPLLSVMLRFFQFRIAADFDSRTLAPLVANAREQEIESTTVPDMRVHLRLSFLVQSLVCLPVPLSQSTIVSRVVEVMHLMQARLHSAEVNNG